MKLATWTKPGTEETRIYFNGIGGSAKVFATEVSGMFVLNFSRGLYTSQQDALSDQIERELEEMNGGERVVRWEDLLKLVK